MVDPNNLKPIEQMTIEEMKSELNELELMFAGPHGPGIPSLTSRGAIESLEWRNKRKHELREKLGLEFWQRTKKSVELFERMPEKKHRQLIENAIAEGKTIPDNVLSDYPDLMR
jgi:hypothetical protein